MFKVSRYGRAKKIQVLALQPEGIRDVRLAAIRLLRDMRFRPQFSEGEAVDFGGVVGEYHFKY